MGKLHELISIEDTLKNGMKKIKDETIVTFSKKGAHFEGGSKQLKMFDDKRSQEDFVEEQELTTTVNDKLAYMKEFFIQYWDSRLKKESANQRAVGGFSIDKLKLEKLPVSFILGMEKELVKLREVFEVIPTLAPGIKWEEDETRGKNVFKSVTPIIKKKTEKKIVVISLAPATKEHKAQVTTVNEDRPVGDYIYEKYSGMITPAQKSKYLKRIDILLMEFTQARQRANNIDVGNEAISESIFDFILA